MQAVSHTPCKSGVVESLAATACVQAHNGKAAGNEVRPTHISMIFVVLSIGGSQGACVSPHKIASCARLRNITEIVHGSNRHQKKATKCAAFSLGLPSPLCAFQACTNPSSRRRTHAIDQSSCIAQSTQNTAGKQIEPARSTQKNQSDRAKEAERHRTCIHLYASLLPVYHSWCSGGAPCRARQRTWAPLHEGGTRLHVFSPRGKLVNKCLRHFAVGFEENGCPADTR
jgi:hypothetical protein